MYFKGQWRNQEGNELFIRHLWGRKYLVKYVRKDGKLLFPNRMKLAICMFPFGCLGKLEDNDLNVSLGGGPFAPDLQLRPYKDLNNDIDMLLPEIIPSLSGYEHVMRISWLEPLSPFFRVIKKDK